MPPQTKSKKPRQYAPWSEHDDEDELIMTDEEIKAMAKKVAEYMRKAKKSDEPAGNR